MFVADAALLWPRLLSYLREAGHADLATSMEAQPDIRELFGTLVAASPLCGAAQVREAAPVQDRPKRRNVAEIHKLNAAQIRAQLPTKPYDAWTESERRFGNLAAFLTLRRLALTGSQTTEDERKALAAWSGWGGIDFDKIPRDPEILTEEYLRAFDAWDALRNRTDLEAEGTDDAKLLLGVVNQFFTPMWIVQGMWDLANAVRPRRGYKLALEPSAGSGRFLEGAPANLPLQWTAVEWDTIGSEVLRRIHGTSGDPDIDTVADVFGDVPFEGFAVGAAKAGVGWDLIIGNPPYPTRLTSTASLDIGFGQYNEAHNYFVARCASLLAPGGIMVMLTPLGEIHSATGRPKPEARALRKYLAGTCRLRAVAALPADVFPGARLNLAVHVWQKLPTEHFGLPEMVGPCTLADFLAGRWFERAPEDVAGTWVRDARFNQMVVEGPHDANWAGRITIRPGLTDGEEQAVAIEYASRFKDKGQGVVRTIVPVTSLDESAATLGRRVRMDQIRADVDTRTLVERRAVNLAERVTAWVKLTHTDPGMAAMGRVELSKDLQDLFEVLAPDDALLDRKDLDPLASVLDESGKLIPQLTNDEVPREIRAVYDTAEAVIRGYATRFPTCEEEDILRHGFTLADATQAALRCDDICMEPEGLGGWRYTLAPVYYSGDLWPRFDLLSRTVDGVGDEVIQAKLTAQRAKLFETIQPQTVETINPTLRSPFVPAAVLSRFVEWFLYDWTPRPEIPINPAIRPAGYPGVLVLIYNGQYKIVPRRKMRRNRLIYRWDMSKKSRWGSFDEWLDTVATEVGPYPDNATGLGEVFVHRGIHPTTEKSERYPTADRFFMRLRWSDTDPATAWSEDFSKYVAIQHAATPRTGTDNWGVDNGDLWGNKYHVYVQKGKHRERVPHDEVIEDRIYALLGYLNQQTSVAPILGSRRESSRQISALASDSAPEQLSPQILEDAFRRWLRDVPQEGQIIADTYNRRFCGRTPATVVTTELILPRRVMAPSTITLRPFQVTAAVRGADQGAMLASLDVGLGKTFLATTIIALLRSRGQGRRSLVVAPNSVTPMWAIEVRRLCPDYLVEVVGFHPTEEVRNGRPVWKPDSAPERLAKWTAFRDGLIDILVVPETRFWDDVAVSREATTTALRRLAVAQKLEGGRGEKLALLRARLANQFEKILSVAGAVPNMQEHIRQGTLEQVLLGVIAGEDPPEWYKEEARGLVKVLPLMLDLLIEIRDFDKAPADTKKGIYSILGNLDWVETLQPFRPRRRYMAWKPSDTLDTLVSVATAIGLSVPPMDDLPPKTQHALLVDLLTAEAPRGSGETIVVEPLIDMEWLGVTTLVIDEGHRYKELFGPLQARDIAFLGAPTGNTASAWDMWLKCQSVHMANQGRGVYLLTATPLKNSPLELFNLLSLVSGDLWRTLGIGTPDQFIDRYLEIDDNAITVDMAGAVGTRTALKDFKEDTLDELRRVVATLEHQLTSDDLRADYEARGELAVYNKMFPVRVDVTKNVDADTIQEAILDPIRTYLAADMAIDLASGRILSMEDRYAARWDTMSKRDEDGELSPVESALWEIEQEDSGATMLLILDIVTKVAADPRLLLETLEAATKNLPTVQKAFDRAFQEAEDAGLAPAVLLQQLEEAKQRRKEKKAGGDGGGEEEGGISGRIRKLRLHPKLRAVMRTHLAITATRRQVEVLTALDIRSLVNGYTAGRQSPKVEEAADMIVANPHGTVVFSDYNRVHQWLVQALVTRGVPKGAIAVITGKLDPPQRQLVAEGFNRGDYRVVIGNTRTMGEGLNLQERTSLLIHMDYPWEPASLRQRDGRAVRQGNKIGRVEVAKLVTPGSADLLRLNAIAAKKGWQDRFRDRDVLAVDNAEVASGNTPSREDLLVAMVYYKDTDEHRQRREILSRYVQAIKAQAEAELRARRMNRIASHVGYAIRELAFMGAHGRDPVVADSLRRDTLAKIDDMARMGVDGRTLDKLRDAVSNARYASVNWDTTLQRLDVYVDGDWAVIRGVNGYVVWDGRGPELVPVDGTRTPESLHQSRLDYGVTLVQLAVSDHVRVRFVGSFEYITVFQASSGYGMPHITGPVKLMAPSTLYGDATPTPEQCRELDDRQLQKAQIPADWRQIEEDVWNMPVIQQRWMTDFLAYRDRVVRTIPHTIPPPERIDNTAAVWLPLVHSDRPGEVVLWSMGALLLARAMHDPAFMLPVFDIRGILHTLGAMHDVPVHDAVKASPYSLKPVLDQFRPSLPLPDGMSWATFRDWLLSTRPVPPTRAGQRVLREAFLADKVRVAVWGGSPGTGQWSDPSEPHELAIIPIPTACLRTRNRPEQLDPSRDVRQAWAAIRGLTRWWQWTQDWGLPWLGSVHLTGKATGLVYFYGDPASWRSSIITASQADALRRTRAGSAVEVEESGGAEPPLGSWAE